MAANVCSTLPFSVLLQVCVCCGLIVHLKVNLCSFVWMFLLIHISVTLLLECAFLHQFVLFSVLQVVQVLLLKSTTL